MAGIETFKIPGFEYYEGEGDYVSPDKVSKETLKRIKSRQIGAIILGV